MSYAACGEAVLDALRQTAQGSALVRPVTAAPDLDGELTEIRADDLRFTLAEAHTHCSERPESTWPRQL